MENEFQYSNEHYKALEEAFHKCILQPNNHDDLTKAIVKFLLRPYRKDMSDKLKYYLENQNES